MNSGTLAAGRWWYGRRLQLRACSPPLNSSPSMEDHLRRGRHGSRQGDGPHAGQRTGGQASTLEHWRPGCVLQANSHRRLPRTSAHISKIPQMGGLETDTVQTAVQSVALGTATVGQATSTLCSAINSAVGK